MTSTRRFCARPLASALLAIGWSGTLEATGSTTLDNQGGTFKGQVTTLTAGQLDN
ncbi:hypothetical protein, partial [Pseudomonas soli]|uniref:hypothetical protein n=1 Tax=Pseudomonas soli TaxID=1306993 RepID=UPI003D04E98B